MELTKSSSTTSLNIIQRFIRNSILQLLSTWQYAHIHFDDGETVHDFITDNSLPLVKLVIKDIRFFHMIALQGEIGLAKAYFMGYWDCNNLEFLFRQFLINASPDLHSGFSVIYDKIMQFVAWTTRNTINKSKTHIAAHYDLSNELFELFLDPSMMYSAAWFDSNNKTLDLSIAQAAKLQHICEALALNQHDHLLEIGSGWGSLACYAAQHYACRVTTTTISEQQYHYAQQKIHQLGLTDRVELLLCDYRKLSGRYDKLVSVEMIEAVGYRHIPEFFKKINQLLKPGGLACIQAIVMNDVSYPRYRHHIDFIRHYIFPGGCLPSNLSMLSAARDARLQLVQLSDLTESYATTLRLWRDNFLKQQTTLETLGFDEQFTRCWDYYFQYCAAGFAEKYIYDGQYVWQKHHYS
ncbi:MAG: cyclopropane-fatty-acyl-phospholipid synthase family protein [Gammaproteobacteria bacterium]